MSDLRSVEQIAEQARDNLDLDDIIWSANNLKSEREIEHHLSKLKEKYDEAYNTLKELKDKRQPINPENGEHRQALNTVMGLNKIMPELSQVYNQRVRVSKQDRFDLFNFLHQTGYDSELTSLHVNFSRNTGNLLLAYKDKENQDKISTLKINVDGQPKVADTQAMLKLMKNQDGELMLGNQSPIHDVACKMIRECEFSMNTRDRMDPHTGDYLGGYATYFKPESKTKECYLPTLVKINNQTSLSPDVDKEVRKKATVRVGDDRDPAHIFYEKHPIMNLVKQVGNWQNYNSSDLHQIRLERMIKSVDKNGESQLKSIIGDDPETFFKSNSSSQQPLMDLLKEHNETLYQHVFRACTSRKLNDSNYSGIKEIIKYDPETFFNSVIQEQQDLKLENLGKRLKNESEKTYQYALTAYASEQVADEYKEVEQKIKVLADLRNHKGMSTMQALVFAIGCENNNQGLAEGVINKLSEQSGNENLQEKVNENGKQLFQKAWNQLDDDKKQALKEKVDTVVNESFQKPQEIISVIRSSAQRQNVQSVTAQSQIHESLEEVEQNQEEAEDPSPSSHTP